MRIIITGASGYLAKTLVPLASMHHDILAVATKPWQNEFSAECVYYDLSRDDEAKKLLTSEHFDAVINAAAVNPGQNDAAMESVNGSWPKFLGEYCAQKNIRLVHVSSDMVHDGTQAPYEDDAKPSAVSLYGRTKAKGEAAIIQSNPQAAIIRTSLIYGLSAIDRGTAGFITQLESGKGLNLFSDVVRQPVWDVDLSRALLDLAERQSEVAGLINVAGDEVISRLDFGMKMLSYWQQPTDHVQAVRASQIAPSVPLDLRLKLNYAQSLGFKTTGVSDVLAKGNSR